MARYREARRLKSIFETKKAVFDMGRRAGGKTPPKKSTTLSIEHPKDVLALVAPALKGRVLDVGIGAGTLAKQLAKQRVKVYGVDLSRFLLKRARMRGAVPIQALGQRTPFRARSFDSAMCIDVIGHVKNPGPLLAEMKRVLKPGGTMVFNVVEKDRYHPRNSFTPGQIEELINKKGLILEGGRRLIESPKRGSAKFLFAYARKKQRKA